MVKLDEIVVGPLARVHFVTKNCDNFTFEYTVKITQLFKIATSRHLYDDLQRCGDNINTTNPQLTSSRDPM